MPAILELRNRRDFLKTTSILAAAGGLAGGLSIGRSAHAAGDDVLKIGLVGCGGRGTGAAVNALERRQKLQARGHGRRLRRPPAKQSGSPRRKSSGDKVAVDPDHCFVGLDSGREADRQRRRRGDSGEPPHFRPKNLKAAIDAGKHVFCEKPVAVDAPGVRSVLATAEEAKKKKLNIVSGLCWRYDYGVRETMKRVLDGAIGEIKSIQETYFGGPLSYRPRQPNWTEMEYQLRNWQYFVWLSGDFNNEQHVHSLDKAAWAMHDETPVGPGASAAANSAIPPKATSTTTTPSSTNSRTASTSTPTAGRSRLRLGRFRHHHRHEGPGQHPGAPHQGREKAGTTTAPSRACTTSSTRSCSPPSARARRSTTASTWPTAR